MASRLYQVGVTTLSAAIGTVLATWTIDRWNSPHTVYDNGLTFTSVICYSKLYIFRPLPR